MSKVMNSQPLKIHIFCCSTSIDADELVRRFNHHGDELKAIPMPCSGKLDILYLTKAFETGADGVAVVTCKPGECQYLEGNLRAKKRVGAVDALLDETGLGKGRMAIIQMNDGGIDHILKEIEDFRSNIKAAPRKEFGVDESELEKE
jgi:F420-non-reducing hydrogenase iron-sulfur subunit